MWEGGNGRIAWHLFQAPDILSHDDWEIFSMALLDKLGIGGINQGREIPDT